MEDEKPKKSDAPDVRSVIREAIQEFITAEQAKSEPAHQAELAEERKRREQLERRVNELVDENRRSREMAEQAERSSAIRSELQRLGVNKVDLAFKAVKDEVRRLEDGRLVGRGDGGELPLKEYLTHFVSENPELLPARMSGGSGAPATPKPSTGATTIDLEKIRPGMSQEELQRAREEIARIATGGKAL